VDLISFLLRAWSFFSSGSSILSPFLSFFFFLVSVSSGVIVWGAGGIVIGTVAITSGFLSSVVSLISEGSSLFFFPLPFSFLVAAAFSISANTASKSSSFFLSFFFILFVVFFSSYYRSLLFNTCSSGSDHCFFYKSCFFIFFFFIF